MVTLERLDGDPARPISQAFRFPVGRPSAAETAASLGLDAPSLEQRADGTTTRDPDAPACPWRPVGGARVHARRTTPSRSSRGHARLIDLRPTASGTPFRGATLTAVNLDGAIEIDAR